MGDRRADLSQMLALERQLSSSRRETPGAMPATPVRGRALAERQQPR
jgi:hypothetical protein